MPSDEQLVEKTRALLLERKKLRWYRLVYGIVLLVMYIWGTLDIVRRLEKTDSLQLTRGFLFGMALAFFLTCFGFFGAVLIAKSRSGFQNGLRSRELLVTYHDRLRQLQALPSDLKKEHGDSPETSAGTDTYIKRPE